MSTEIFATYFALLRGESVELSSDKPCPGLYEWRTEKGKRGQPVKIAPVKDDPETMVAYVNGTLETNIDRICTIWVGSARRAVSKQAYNFRMDNGRWEDDPVPIDRSNRPSDPLEALLADVKDKTEQVENFLKTDIETQVQCDMARNMQAQVLQLKKQADEMFEVEKRPVIEAGKRLGVKYGFRDSLASLAANLRLRFEAFMIKEEKRREAEHAVEQARLDAERAELMDSDPALAMLDEAPVAAPVKKVTAGGGFGRKSGLKTVWVAVLTDYPAALQHYAENARVRELIQKLADTEAKSGSRNIPGFEVKEGRRAA